MHLKERLQSSHSFFSAADSVSNLTWQIHRHNSVGGSWLEQICTYQILFTVVLLIKNAVIKIIM